MELYLKVRLAIREGMSAREAARHFGISRESVKKMLSFSVPPGYRRTAPIKRPKLDGFTESSTSGYVTTLASTGVHIIGPKRPCALRIWPRMTNTP